MGAEDFFERGDMIIFWENLGWRKEIFFKMWGGNKISSKIWDGGEGRRYENVMKLFFLGGGGRKRDPEFHPLMPLTPNSNYAKRTLWR